MADFWDHDSLMDSPVGGILCFVRKSLCPNKKNICFEHFLRGRIVRLCLLGESDFGDSSATFWNVHNFGIPAGAMKFCNAMAFRVTVRVAMIAPSLKCAS